MILLTGATGFLGRNILKKLLEEQYHVVILNRNKFSQNKIADIQGEYQQFYLSEHSIEYLYKKYPITTIINAAVSYGRNNNFEEVIDTNLKLPLNLIENGLRHKLSIFINTDSYYSKHPISAAHLPHYTMSKISLTMWLKFFSNQIQTCNLVLEHLYGPDDSKDKFCKYIIEKIAIEKVTSIRLTSGKQTRDFIHVKDVANAYSHVLKNIQSDKFNYRSYEIGTGKHTEIREFVETVKKLSQANTVLRFGEIPYKEGEIMSSVANISEIIKTGWYPTFSLEQGIMDTILFEKLKGKEIL